MNGEDILLALVIAFMIGVVSFLIVVIAGLLLGFARFGVC